MPEPLLTTAEAAAYLQLTVQTLARWRMARPGKGPPYCKLGRGLVRYRREDLEAWVQATQAPALPASSDGEPETAAEATSHQVIPLQPRRQQPARPRRERRRSDA
jgi:predicted DNA-binding transcriptional regulator AlpA